ncbi:SURF1 family protein [Tranquillimonas rosea]|uniref:SURF1 family protein n=1 Tax=Tranquillimonas rosea TaxID=641238 RepID=UPI003BABA0C9
MLRRMIFPLVLGLGGCALLIGLGVWQVQRLAWKTGVLAEIEARIDAPPQEIPADPDPTADRYLPVTVAGGFEGEALRVLVSPGNEGPGYRIIGAFETEGGRRIMVDRGFVPEDRKDAARPGGAATVTGNLHWPDETDGFTPDPDRAGNVWFARNVSLMAEALETEPVLVVARQVDGPEAGITPLPVGTEGIPNDHLEYAITWFSLAVIWAGMTGLLLWRIRQRATAGNGQGQ